MSPAARAARGRQPLRWIANRLKKKYGIPVATTKEVLGAIADLEWDWRHSLYDLSGFLSHAESEFEELGKKRRPKGYKEYG